MPVLISVFFIHPNCIRKSGVPAQIDVDADDGETVTGKALFHLIMTFQSRRDIHADSSFVLFDFSDPSQEYERRTLELDFTLQSFSTHPVAINFNAGLINELRSDSMLKARLAQFLYPPPPDNSSRCNPDRFPPIDSVSSEECPALNSYPLSGEAFNPPSAQDLLPRRDLDLWMVTDKKEGWSPKDVYEKNKVIQNLGGPRPSWLREYLSNMHRRRELSSEAIILDDLIESSPRTSESNAVITNLFCLGNEDVHSIELGQNPASRAQESIMFRQAYAFSQSSMFHTLNETKFLSFFKNLLLFTIKLRSPLTEKRDLDIVYRRNKALEKYAFGVLRKILQPSSRCFFQFRPDVLLRRGLEPYLFIEFLSRGCKDYNRMLCYGAAVLKWMCSICNYHFILPLLCVFDDGRCELIYMYRPNPNNLQVSYIIKDYDLRVPHLCIKLFATILNIID
ncbi:hypothetical protein D9757_008189 [Collybiopsis confluens]|uniref:Uncharacterized protein n=1 Tax=Collybiopsis confluens TaxID=2823264 RepID=A0A8H5HAY8_9AGAR|nr:hypothetical protein D9757_008189 [Collybiopsis confluens]